MGREWIIIRHGEADHMVGSDPLTGGWTDTHLTERGREQARRTGLALAADPPEGAYGFWCSDLARARETAEIIGRAAGRTPVPHTALREFNNGVAAGMTRREAHAVAAPLAGHVGDWRPYEGGENWREFMARVNRFADGHLAQGSHVIVCHSGTAFNLVFRFLGLEERYLGQVYTDLDPCGIIRLRTSEFGENTIRCLNDRSHLAAPCG